MERSVLRDQIIHALCKIAPELDTEKIETDVAFRQKYDLDSADFLNFIQVIYETLGVTIPERDYSKLSTISEAAKYLAIRLDKRSNLGESSDKTNQGSDHSSKHFVSDTQVLEND